MEEIGPVFIGRIAGEDDSCTSHIKVAPVFIIGINRFVKIDIVITKLDKNICLQEKILVRSFDIKPFIISGLYTLFFSLDSLFYCLSSFGFLFLPASFPTLLSC